MINLLLTHILFILLSLPSRLLLSSLALSSASIDLVCQSTSLLFSHIFIINSIKPINIKELINKLTFTVLCDHTDKEIFTFNDGFTSKLINRM